MTTTVSPEQALCNLALKAADLKLERDALQARLDEATQLLRDVVDGEEGDYPVQQIRAFLKGVDNG